MMQTSVGFLMCILAPVAPIEDKPNPPTVKKPALRDELLQRIKPDQKIRKELIAWMKKNKAARVAKTTGRKKKPSSEFVKLVGQLRKIDAANTKWLKQVVAKNGWPTATLAGKDGAQAAWLLVQHADAAPEFQRRCLDLMSKLPKGEVSRANVAYLTDRVLLAEGEKQLYGTQFHLVDGKWQPKPLEDPAKVDERRAAAGLSTLTEYAKLIQRQHSSGGKKAKSGAKRR